MSTSITVQQRASLAIGGSEYEEELREMALRSTSIVAISNRAGLQECHAARMVLKSERLEIGKNAKLATEDAKAFVAAVGARAKDLVAILAPEEGRLSELQSEYLAEQERIKEAARKAEQARVDSILNRISEISSFPAIAAGSDLFGANEILSHLGKISIDESYQELAEIATIALQNSKDAVYRIVARKKEDEEAAEIARKEAEEAAARRAAAVEAARIAKAEQDARIAAERKAESDRLAAEREKLAAERAEFDAKRAAILAEIESSRKLAEEKKAAERAEAEKAEAIRRAK